MIYYDTYAWETLEVMTMYRCVCFDFDGTLADTEEMMLRIYNSMASRYHYKPISEADRNRIKAMTLNEILMELKIPTTRMVQMLVRGRKQLKKQNSDIMPFKDGMPEFFEQLKRYVPLVGILTSNTKNTVSVFLENHGLSEYIDFMSCAVLFHKEKRLERVCRKRKIAPSEMLYVGDETRDIVSCRKAGIDVAAVTWGYNLESTLRDCHPTYIVSSLDAILSIVKNKNKRLDRSGKEHLLENPDNKNHKKHQS